jgi:hypothetical protein
LKYPDVMPCPLYSANRKIIDQKNKFNSAIRKVDLVFKASLLEDEGCYQESFGCINRVFHLINEGVSCDEMVLHIIWQRLCGVWDLTVSTLQIFPKIHSTVSDQSW